MPYIPNMDQEEQPLQNAVAPGAGGTRLSSSGLGNTSATGGAMPAQGNGGQFATLQSYLAANQSQAQPLANKITGNINKQYENLSGQNAQTLSGIQGQVAAGATPQDSGTLAAEAANPVSFASTPENVQRFQGLLNASYSGPTQAEDTADYQKQQAAVNKAIATGQTQIGSEAGRKQLLEGTERRPTTGVTALNSAILTQSPEYLGQVEQAYKPFQNLVSGLQSGASDINKQIAANQTRTQQEREQANKQVQEQIGGLNTNLQNTLASQQEAVNAYNTALPDYQNSLNNINQVVGQWNAYKYAIPNFGFEASYAPITSPAANIVPKEAVAPTLEGIATPEQYKQAQAFSNLVGGLGNYMQPIIGANTANKAGTFTSPGSVPTTDAQKAETIKALDAARQKIYNDVLKPLPQISSEHGGAAYMNLITNLDKEIAALKSQLNQ